MAHARSTTRGAWDLTALLNAADPRASQPERHVWLIRLAQWLRHRNQRTADVTEAAATASAPTAPSAVVRLKHLLNVLEKSDLHRERVRGMLQPFLAEVDAATLFADWGFAPRMGFVSELAERLRQACLPSTPQTGDLGALFGLIFTSSKDADWLEAIDPETLGRVLALLGPDLATADDWRAPLFESITVLVSHIRAAGFAAEVRQRMDPAALAGRPFQHLSRAAERVWEASTHDDRAALLRATQQLRDLLQTCRRAARSVGGHLEAYGVSVDVVFQVDQLCARADRIDALLDCIVSLHPAPEMLRLLAALVRVRADRDSTRALFARQYSLLARKVAERSAETGEHYITRDRAGWYAMLRKALGGGAVIAVTTFVKFLVVAIGFSAFWAGFWAGINYAASFVVIHLLHWTVATKQPAMTAPAMAAKLEDISHDADVEAFVDEVAHLIRSQVAGIVGNLVMVAPVVLAVQIGWQLAFGRPLVGESTAQYVLHSLTLLGPTLFYAAFTGVLLFASSLIAGWVENWFVWHRIDSAIEWNPRIVMRLGAPRAHRWARWWRANISGIAANVSLGLLLGLVPVVATFFGLPIEVRHVTLSTGQIAAAAGSYGWHVLERSEFWWCVAAIPFTGFLNLTVSFFLAFKVALRSRGLQVGDRSRLYRAIRHRLRSAPGSFLWPVRVGAVAGTGQAA